MYFAGETLQWAIPPIAPHIFYINPCSITHAPTACIDPITVSNDTKYFRS